MADDKEVKKQEAETKEERDSLGELSAEDLERTAGGGVAPFGETYSRKVDLTCA